MENTKASYTQNTSQLSKYVTNIQNAMAMRSSIKIILHEQCC